MRRPEWLERESEAWQIEGLVSEDQRRLILARYPQAGDPQRAAHILVWLALLVAGFGLILLVAWNWYRIPDPVKIGATIGLTAVLYGLAAAFARAARRPVVVEGVAFAAALAAGAALAALNDVYLVDPENALPVLAWAVVLGITSLLAASVLTAGLGAVAVVWWMLLAGGHPPPPWGFLLVWPMLALTVEVRPNRWVAGAVTIAFGLWAAFVAIDVWSYPALGGVFLVAAGGALDAWAHYPLARRPKFARATPALLLTIIGLFIVLIMILTTSVPPANWHQSAGGQAPALALFAAVVGVVIWPAAGRRPPSTRALVFAGLAAVWMVLWLVSPNSVATSGWWRWGWAVALSGAFVFITVVAVREAAATRDRGLFATGLVSIGVMVIAHLLGSHGRPGRSALVLLAASAILLWISRMWIRRRASGAPS
jgi:uncharacterized membrane protein